LKSAASDRISKDVLDHLVERLALSRQCKMQYLFRVPDIFWPERRIDPCLQLESRLFRHIPLEYRRDDCKAVPVQLGDDLIGVHFILPSSWRVAGSFTRLTTQHDCSAPDGIHRATVAAAPPAQPRL